MNRLFGKLFLGASITLFALGFVGESAQAKADPWCPNDNIETCEDLDLGCNAMNPHYFCKWRDTIEHCNCTVILPGGGGF